MGATEEIIMTRIVPVLGYMVLKKYAPPPGVAPLFEPVALWHPGNHSNPEAAAKTTLRQLRALGNGNDRRTYAIALVSMPPDEEFR